MSGFDKNRIFPGNLDSVFPESQLLTNQARLTSKPPNRRYGSSSKTPRKIKLTGRFYNANKQQNIDGRRQMHPSEEIHVNASLVFNFERSLGSIPSEAAAATFARIFFRPMVFAIFLFNIFH